MGGAAAGAGAGTLDGFEVVEAERLLLEVDRLGICCFNKKDKKNPITREQSV
jgi:hypothetical protein